MKKEVKKAVIQKDRQMGSQASKGWTVSELVGWSSWAESKVKLDTDCKQADKRQPKAYLSQTVIPLLDGMLVHSRLSYS